MSNVLFIIADSLSFDRIEKYRHQKNCLTPFLNSIEGQCITAEHLYSQGPYTEAGTKGLLCCCDTLDNGGYFCRYDTQERFITDIFKDWGYETYNINAPSYLLSKRTLSNIDHMIYTSGIDFRFLWSQRFSFYYDRWKSGKFTEEDYAYLADFVELVFESIGDFLCSENSDEKYDIISPLIDEDVIKQNNAILNQEMAKFVENKNKYMDSVFELQLNHPIFQIKNINLSDMIQTEKVCRVLAKNKKFVRKFKRIQFFRNLRNNPCTKGVFSRTIKGIWRDKKPTKSNCGELLNRLRNLISGREFEVFKTGLYYTKDPYKLVASAKTQIEYAVNVLEKSDHKNNFVFIHPEEAHYFNTFFTYDSQDESLIESEINDAADFVKSLDKNYKGSLFYDLSVRYLDTQIKNLYHSLEEKGLLKDTLVVVTADHGSSYFFDPVRKSLVNNFHSENYHVPIYIFGGGVQGRSCDGMYMGKDVIPTIADICGHAMSGGSGMSMLNKDNDRESVMIEYMGPGCPDIRLKPVWLSSRSRKYAVSYIGKLSEEFSESNICEIYDLIKDPEERNNIKDVRNENINRQIDLIRERFESLRETTSISRK